MRSMEYEMKPKWLFFDVGTMLIDESKAFDHRIREAIVGTDITFEQFNEKRKEFAKQNLRGDLEAIDHFGLARTPWHKEDEYPYPEAEGVLEYLHGKGFKLGVIANQSLGTAAKLGLVEIYQRSCGFCGAGRRKARQSNIHKSNGNGRQHSRKLCYDRRQARQ